MPKNARSRSTGWLALEFVIGVLVVLLLLSIHVPKRQWDGHSEKEQMCRQRLENIYFASHFFFQKNNSFTEDMAELLQFADAGSLKVFPAGFKLDRLTRSDSGIDSFMVDYFDPSPLFMHFQEVPEISYPSSRDSVVLEIVPLPSFNFLPTTKYTFAAESSISVAVDDRGDQGKFLLVGTQGLLRRSQILADVIEVPAANYIYNIPIDDIAKCPSTESEFQTWINVRVAIVGEMMGTLEDTVPEQSLSSSPLLSSIVVYRWLKQSDAMANATLVQEKTFDVVEDSMIISWNNTYLDSISAVLRIEGKAQLATAIYDSLLEDIELVENDFEPMWEEIREGSYTYMNSLKDHPEFITIRDNFVNDFKMEIATQILNNLLETARTTGIITISESGIINTSHDSIVFYSDSDLIRKRLFTAHTDSVTKLFLARTDIKELMSSFSYTETHRVARVDSTGITIVCPISGAFISPKRSFLEKVFTVEGEANHGNVEDGDLSWSDKR